MPEDKDVLSRGVQAFERIASTTERVGIPVGTFAIGSIAVLVAPFLGARIDTAVGSTVAWIGLALIVCALLAYVWLTSRFTTKVQQPPPPLQPELKDMIEWMKLQIEKSQADPPSHP
ncbi:MAG: hypothetical protein ACYS9X_11180 [Planctomycetota bacterium]|jgi:hypothetical protein